MPHLPRPDADAIAHASRVAAYVRQVIDAGDGWIAFARYMDIVLHAPGLGYYAAGAPKLGPAGDFVTAPEMTPLFATALATQVAAILDASTRREVLELGAGTGRLAADLLRALALRDALPARYAILETSPELRQRQERTLAELAPEHAQRVAWLAALPAEIDGAVLANEVLDAIATHVVVQRAGVWCERGVTVDAANASGPRHGFAWADRAAPAFLAKLADDRVPRIDGYVTEINPAAEALVEDIARRLVHGAALFIDYGFPQAEYYHPQRTAGTLMCHYRHHAHDDPFLYPGLGDITAHVDFSAMADAGIRGGLHVAGFAAQAPFLMGCGILDALTGVGDPQTLRYIEAASAVQRLLSPAEMGELFKVLALARTEPIAWPGFALVNHAHRL
jgi:SAM-dependent MidA family methyltransferase